MSATNGVKNGDDRLPMPKRGERTLDLECNVVLLQALHPSDDAIRLRGKYALEAEMLAAELAGSNPGPAESVLAATAAANWLAGRLLASRYAACLGSGENVGVLDHLQRSVTRCERRMMLAIRHLQSLRRLDIKLSLLKLSIEKDLPF
jgi:hypothetical protein